MSQHSNMKDIAATYDSSGSTARHVVDGIASCIVTPIYDQGGSTRVRIVTPATLATTVTADLAEPQTRARHRLDIKAVHEALWPTARVPIRFGGTIFDAPSGALEYRLRFVLDPCQLPRDDALPALKELFANPIVPRGAIWWLLTLPPWYWQTWREVTEQACRRHGVPRASWDDVIQEARQSLAWTLATHDDAREWLDKSEEQFHGWFCGVISKLVGHVLRTMGLNGADSEAADKPRFFVTSPIELDHRPDGHLGPNDPADVASLLDEAAPDLPRRTKDVAVMRADHNTWPEVAETLGTTEDRARWAIQSQELALRRALGLLG